MCANYAGDDLVPRILSQKALTQPDAFASIAKPDSSGFEYLELISGRDDFRFAGTTAMSERKALPRRECGPNGALMIARRQQTV